MKLLNCFLACASVSIVLCGCGGGSGTSPVASTPTVSAPVVVSNAAPSANAGMDQAALVSTVVVLDGGASSDPDRDPLTFAWQLISKPPGSNAAFSASSSVRPQFTVDMAGIFTAALTVSDGKNFSTADFVSITASNPITTVLLPIANAGANQNVLVGATVVLDGSASSAQNANALTYRWVLISKPVGNAALTNSTASKAGFVADTTGSYTIGLVVNNGVRDSLMATTVINALALPSTANIAPVANAGADQLVTTGATVNLDGTSSKDANGDRLSYLWTLVTKPSLSNASLSSALLGVTSFRADLSGVYEVRLSVNDGRADSATSDLISIVAQLPSAITIADNGSYRCSALSKDQALALYAAGHTYLDRDHDGKPCEANDLLNELTSPYIAPAPATSGKCWVNGYTRKNGTYVHGYYRSC